MNVLVCDDLKDDADKIAAIIKASPLNVKAVSFSSASEVLNYFKSGAAVDACFLDIVMPETNGVTLAEKLRESGYKGEIVFITTSNDYACESYRVNAFDYLLKPAAPKAVENVLETLKETKNKIDNKGLTVKTKAAAKFIKFCDISYAEADGHSVHIRKKDGENIKTYSTFTEITQKLLEDKRFVQSHRSFILNMSDIETVKSREITMRSGSRVPISRGFSQVKNEMLKWLFG
ncbi:MAG: LytTR family DNA-binding domain-containing protein [Treponema sp.]|nr:LytTR family DNA-binding domain-containing protein [Treponema sp.]